MKLVPVRDRQTQKQFLEVPRIVYKDDPVWVCPLDNEIESVFDPLFNPFHRHGKVDRWILLDDNNNLTGRIAAFIDWNLARCYDQPTGGAGFFECLNNMEAARMLFDQAKEWLRLEGMEAMDAPVNFGETDKYWGLLVDGFTHPSFDVPYNPPYYCNLFESYGFQTYYKMEGFHLDLRKPFPQRFIKIAEWISKKPDYEFRHFTWKDEDNFVKDFAEVFNGAWAKFKAVFEPLETSYIKSALRKARAIIDEEFIWIAYFKGNPVGIFLMFPDMNQILKHLNGKLDLPGIVKFLWFRKRKAMTRTKVLLMGVIPSFQNHGVESALMLKVLEVLRRKPHYTEAEFSWVADFNPKMRSIFVSVGGVPAKNYITYRYIFDRTKDFRRYPFPEMPHS
jgi:GNAT superfamily N-acetyltransferase